LVNQEKKTTRLKMEIEIAGMAGFLFAATSVGVLICERQKDALQRDSCGFASLDLDECERGETSPDPERPSPASGYDAD